MTVPPGSTHFDAWLKVHRQLLDQETALADMAVDYASGRITEAEFNDAHRKLVGLRLLAEAVLQKAMEEQRKDQGRP